jgi:hypothetical protein
MRKFLVLLALLALSCASKPLPVPEEPWTSVPAQALDALCEFAVHGEGIGRQSPVGVMAESQPLVTDASVRALAQAYVAQKVVQRLDPPAVIPVTVPSSGCKWRAIEPAGPPAPDQYLLELSAPIPNPFARNQSGVFARLSLGGQAAYWYWVPLMRRGRVTTGRVVMLDIRD